MLQNIQNWSKSWFLKIMMGALFGFLILSFAVWGIGDIFRQGGRQANFIVIGDIAISETEFMETLRIELRRLQEGSDAQIDLQLAAQLGIVDGVVQNVVNRALFDLAARDAGVTVSDETLRTDIMNNPAFKGLGGQFDPMRFQDVLYQSGFTESAFLSILRQDMIRAQVTESIASGVRVPTQLTDALFRYRAEKRIAETVFVADDKMALPNAPSENELADFHERNADRYMSEERRTITAISLNAEEIAKTITVDDEQLREAYDQRLDEFRVPERRKVEQILASDEATAQRVHDLLKAGRSFSEAADEATGLAPIELGTLARSEFVVDALGETAFGLVEGSFGSPVQSDLGWHVLRVTAVEPGYSKTFAEARTDLQREIAGELAIDAMFDLANAIEDELGGGATLDELRERLGVSLLRFADIDRQGHTVAGTKPERFPEIAGLLETTFSLGESEESRMTETDDGGYYLVRVDAVKPARINPLEEVRDRVIADWEQEQRHTAAEKLANTVLKRVKSGENPAVIADEGRYDYAQTAPFTREGTGLEIGFPLVLVGPIFRGAIGESAVAEAPGGYMIARLTDIVVAEPTAGAEARTALETQLRDGLTADIFFGFGNAIRERYGVDVNREAIARRIGS